MSSYEKRLHNARSAAAAAVVLLAGFAPAIALAQQEPPPVAAAAAPDPAPKLAAATALQETTPATNVVTHTEPPPPPAVEDPSAKPLSTAVWGRIGNVIQGSDRTKLNDFAQDAEVDVILSGQIHKFVGWQADFVGTFGPDQTGTANILDLIGKLELHHAFNLWAGRMLVPSDRSNFSGPWFMAPWNYPGFYPGLRAPAGPRQGPFGRNDGFTVWGDFGGGVFKYYLGAFDLHARSESPLYTARVNLSLLNPEPGFYHSSTYYGTDILAIGVSAQYKKNGSVAPDPVVPPGGMPVAGPPPANYTGFSADVLYEKKLGGAGVIDLEGAYYIFDGDNELLKSHFYGLVSYLTPMQLGFGYLQPLIRFQGASPKGDGDMWRLIDAQVGYVISQYAARLAVGYQSGKAGETKTNAVFVGLQLQK